jgi:hypothetical protein
MIEIAINGGARLLDFDIYALNFSKSGIPIVTVAHDKTNRNLMHNYVTLEKCFQTIHKCYLKQNQTPPLDPLFLHLNIHNSVSEITMNNIAKLIIYYFQQYNGNYLLAPNFHYQKTNLGSVPLCTLLGKVIIMVSIKNRNPSPLLDELINSRTNFLFTKSYSWLDVKNYYSKQELIDNNKYRLSLVKTSFDLYAKNDENTMFSKTTINNDPLICFNTGCQFIMMNFQLLDSNLLTYLSYFKKSSFVLKPKSLQRPPPMLTDKITSASGDAYYVICDPSNVIGDPNLKQTYCDNIAQQYRSSESSQTISNTENKIKSQFDNINENINTFRL